MGRRVDDVGRDDHLFCVLAGGEAMTFKEREKLLRDYRNSLEIMRLEGIQCDIDIEPMRKKRNIIYHLCCVVMGILFCVLILFLAYI